MASDIKCNHSILCLQTKLVDFHITIIYLFFQDLYPPSILLYASTLRCLQHYQVIDIPINAHAPIVHIHCLQEYRLEYM